jgi:YbbR domain-containing protein
MKLKSLTRNLGLKIFSVLVAILLSYGVNSESNSSVISLVVPIEIKNPPEGKVLVRPVRRSVQVTIKGPSFIVGPVASSPPALRVKLPAQNDGHFPVTLKSSDLPLPPTIEVLGIEPSEMEFVFEPVEQREIKIEVPRIGQLPRQMTLDKLEINPKTVIATGPKSEVSQIRSVETEPIDLREVKGNTTVNLNLRVPGSQTSLSTSTVSASIELAMIPQERMIDARPVELRAAPEMSGLKLDPPRVMVVIAGAPDAVAAVDPASVIPYVRVREMPEKDSVSASVDVELPPGITLVKVEPRKVEIRKESGKAAPIRSKSAKPR